MTTELRELTSMYLRGEFYVDNPTQLLAEPDMLPEFTEDTSARVYFECPCPAALYPKLAADLDAWMDSLETAIDDRCFTLGLTWDEAMLLE